MRTLGKSGVFPNGKMAKSVLACFILMFFPVSGIWAETGILIAYENDIQFPYYMGKGEDVLAEKPGIAVEMIQMLGERIPGIKVRLARYPWKRCLFLLQSGNVDGIFNASFKSERLEIGAFPFKNGAVDPSRRITTIAYSLYKLKDSNLGWNGRNFTNLNGKIGAPYGYSIIGDLENMGIEVDAAGATETNLAKLLKKRIPGIALQDVTGDYFLRAHPLTYKDIVKVAPPITTKPYYLMLSRQFTKKHTELAETIWNTIGEIRETESVGLSDKYFTP